MDKKHLTVSEMWHFVVFQTKGYAMIKVALTVGIITTAALPYLNSVFSAEILDKLIENSYGEARKFVLVMIVVIFAVSMLSNACNRILHHYTEPCEMEIRKRTADKAFRMEYEEIEKKEILTAFRRVRAGETGNGGIEKQIYKIYDYLTDLVSVLFAAAFGVRLLLSSKSTESGRGFSVMFFLLVAAAFLMVLFLSRFFSEKKGKLQVTMERKNEENNTRGSYLFGLIMGERGVKDIRLYDLRDYLLEKGKPLILSGRSYTIFGNRCGILDGILAFAVQLLSAFTYVYIAMKALAGSISIGSVVMYAGAVITMMNSIQRMMSRHIMIDYTNEYLKIYEEFIKRPNMHYDGTLPIEKRDDNQYQLAFHKVSFCYPGTEQYVLKNFSIRFNIGEKLALVGLNGAGKTTLIKLLCRFYEPTEGQILLNGIDIGKYDYDEYASIFSVVFQDFRLFDFPLDENVAAGEQVEKEKLWNSLEKAGMKERIVELPEKEKTLLYHENGKGVALSGGEAQKLAIARALYKDAPFVILDEPTAALDPLAEAEIYEHFSQLVQDKTAIYISHRMSSCKFCDRIVVIGNGQILEEGNHEDLMQRQGEYYRLYSAQAQYYK